MFGAVVVGSIGVLAAYLFPVAAIYPLVGSLAFALAGIVMAVVVGGIVGWQRQENRRLRRNAERLTRNADVLGNLAMHDPLTGLFNRRYLEPTLAREAHRANRAGASLAVIMLDLDYFKQVNDRFGHELGDELLRQLGTLLQERTRGDDIASRYGGEEFVLVLPNASLVDAQARAEDLRAETQRLPVQQELCALGMVTVSAGIAVLPEHGTTAQALLHAADTALYRAKAAGRDRVAGAESARAVPAYDDTHGQAIAS